MIKKIVIVMVASLLLVPIAAAVTAADGNPGADEYAGQDADLEGFEEIHDWHDLDSIRDNRDDEDEHRIIGDYVLMNDLDEDTDGYDELVDEGNGWKSIGQDPIDNIVSVFGGTFDGNGYEIRDLRQDRTDNATSNGGVFDVIAFDGKVYNLGIVNADITVNSVAGGLAAELYSCYAVENVYVRDSEIHTYGVPDQGIEPKGAGGIVGSIRDTSLINSYAHNVDVEAVGMNHTWYAGTAIGTINYLDEAQGVFNVMTDEDDDNDFVGRNSYDGDERRVIWGRSGQFPEDDLASALLYTEDDWKDYEDFHYPEWDIEIIYSNWNSMPKLRGDGGWEIYQKPILTINISGEGEELNYGEGNHSVGEGTEVELEASSHPWSEFDYWAGYESSDDKNVSFKMPQGRVYIRAYFNNITFDLDVDVEGDGWVSIEPDKTEYEYGEVVDVEANAYEGSMFAVWGGDRDVTDTNISVNMTEDKELTAYFGEKQELQLNIVGIGEELNYGEGIHYFAAGTPLTLEADPGTGYEFIEWTGYMDSGEKELEFTMPHQDITVAAIFEKADFELNIAIDGGGQELDFGEGTHYIEYEEYVELEASSDQGWSFDLWSGHRSTTGNNISFDMPAKDITMTAEFSRNTYELTIIVDGPGEELNYGEGFHNIYYDTSVELEAKANAGYEFVSWSGYEFGTSSTIEFDMPANDITMTASIAADAFDLTIEIVGNGTEYTYGEGTHPIPYDQNVGLEAVSDDCSYFLTWSGYMTSNFNEITFTMPAQDVTVTAHFEKHIYDLDIEEEGAGLVSVDPDEENYEHGTEIDLKAHPGTGHEFIEWTGDYEGTSDNVSFEIKDDMDIVAVFSTEVYYLEVDIEGEGDVELNPEEDEYEHGENVKLEAVSEYGHHFMEWTGDSDSEYNSIVLTMEENKSVTAHFEEVDVYTLEVTVQGEGDVEIETERDEYEEGEEVVLEAVAEEGYELVEWSGDYDSTDEEITVTMDEDMNITAHFEEEDSVLPRPGTSNFFSENWEIILVAIIVLVMLYFIAKKRSRS